MTGAPIFCAPAAVDDPDRAAPPDDNLVEVSELTVEFGSGAGAATAVDRVSFAIPRGQTVGLVGESGSGKSATALALMRLIPDPPGRIAAGRIMFEGRNLLDCSAAEMRALRGNRIAMIFQEPMTSLNPVFTVGDQIMETILLHQGLPRRKAAVRTIELLAQVGISRPAERMSAFPHELSGGQRQRVMIAIAIACAPDLLIADEPTTSLDVTIQKQILDLLAGLQRQYRMSILFISHDLGVIGDIADRVLVMYRGRIVDRGSAAEVLESPRHPYAKALLACRPSLERSPRRLATISDFMDENGCEKPFDLAAIGRPKAPRPLTDRNPVLLELRDIAKYFPARRGPFGRVRAWVKAVDGVNLVVRRGRTMGLIGESGCGKTTLGRIVLRLIEATRGDIVFDGTNLRSLSRAGMREIRKRVQIIFQDPFASLDPRMTVGAALVEPMTIHAIGKDHGERLQSAAELLARCGLPRTALARFPHEFSGGQRQRICIARALVVKPELIVCDECVSALDVSVQAQILNLLMDLQEEFDLTYIFISHDMAVVKFVSDELCVLNHGKVVEYADSETIYREPKDDYTKQLLAAIPKGIPRARPGAPMRFDQ